MREYSTLHLPSQAHSLDRARPKSFGRRLRPNMRAELLAAIVVAVLFTVCGAVYFCAELLSEKKIYGNVFIEGVDISGKSKEEVHQLFAGRFALPGMGVTIELDDKKWAITAQDVGAHYNVDAVIAQAYDVGRKGGVFKRLGEILSLRKERREFKFSAAYDESTLEGIAKNVAQEMYLPAIDATMQFNPDSADIFNITDEAPGRTVNADALQAMLKASLDQGGYSTLSMKSDTIMPVITAAMLTKQTQLLGYCTTVLKKDAQRTSNIKLAGEAVNGIVLLSGDEFSFNAATGERTKANGYMDAPTIAGSQLVDAPGGGVCQVSSTIYCAALLSGLEITERHNHTWPVAYAEAGRDATVDWASNKDLRFKNNTSVNIYLVFRVDEAKAMVTAEIYGLPGVESISVVAEGYETIMPGEPMKYSNPNKPIGWSRPITAARSGYRVSIYREYADGGNTRRELVSNDFYPPQRGEIEIGTKSSVDDNK